MNKQKFPNGSRVKVLVGHPMWQIKDGKCTVIDIQPQLKNTTATVLYTYASRFGGENYKDYGLRFDRGGEQAWFDESKIVLAKGFRNTIMNILAKYNQSRKIKIN